MRSLDRSLRLWDMQAAGCAAMHALPERVYRTWRGRRWWWGWQGGCSTSKYDMRQMP